MVKHACDNYVKLNMVHTLSRQNNNTVKKAFLMSVTHMSDMLKEFSELVLKRKHMVANLLKQIALIS